MRGRGELWVIGWAKTHQKIVAEDKAPEPITYSALALDAKGKPYLAAASLRGFLAQACSDATTRRLLFGYAEQESGLAGAVRIYDACLRHAAALPPDSPTKHTALRSHVSLDPVTGTAQDHLLFSREYVPQGSVFELCLELDRVDEEDLATVRGLLECWDGGPHSAIGGGTGKGYGRLQWNREKIEVISTERLRDWLADDSKSLWEDLPNATAAVKPQRRTGMLISYTLTPQGPFLLNDRAYVGVKKNKPGEENTETPDLEYSRTPDGRALIPSTALRGWLRGRARRILLTILVAQNQPPEKADEEVDTLFGNTKKRGLLNFSDAVSDKAVTEHPQMFNAIDRFTGGVATGKLYQTRAVVECGALHGEAWLTPGKSLEDWYKGLLLLLARDLLEGDLVLGWGKGRGYGAFTCALEVDGGAYEQWPALRAFLDEPKGECGKWLSAMR